MRGWWPLWLALLAALAPMAASAAPSSLVAQTPTSSAATACHAEGSVTETVASVVAQPSRWHCDGGEPSLRADRAFLAFKLAPGTVKPAFFSSRTALFEGLTLAVIRDARVEAERSYAASDISFGAGGRRFVLPLPDHVGAADTIVAAIDRSTSRSLFGDARVGASNPVTSAGATSLMLLQAIVCGMLAMPLLFNVAFYRILREKFVLWHLAVTATLLIQCLLTSGILGHFVALTAPVYSRLLMLTFGLSVASAAAFCASFIEPGRLDPRLRKALYLGALQVLAVTLFHTFLPNAFRAVQTPVYYASFLPVLGIFLAVMVDASRRRSRAVRYQIIAWAPFLAVGIIRIVTMLVPSLVQTEAMGLFYFSVVVESMATSLGVADRFMAMRRQRDRALSRAERAESLSERDALTGLYNRRALDGPLGNFAGQGFTGFALIDLDNFKRVNDTHGHATGDAVLRTVATLLDAHQDAVALRLGGEEFLLLLRGPAVQERVERLREAIPVRIAREVTQLEALVTASAGLVEAARHSVLATDFADLYREADELLYEAKHNGRNLLAAVTRQATGASRHGAVDAA